MDLMQSARGPHQRRKYAPNRIREERNAQHLTQEDLGLAIGITPQTIKKLEHSEMGLTVDYMLAIAKALNIPPEHLLPNSRFIGSRALPLLGASSASKWRDALAEVQDFITVEDQPALGGPNTFALRPPGNSMNLLLADGGFIAVDPEQLDLRDGKYYAIADQKGETAYRRFQADPARLEPCSSNPALAPIFVGREPFTVIGRITLRMDSPK